MRRSRHHTQKTPDHGRMSETVSIRERPAEAEDRAVPGHWEGDLFFGSHNSQIASLVERQTRYLMLVKVTGKDTETVVDALIKQARKLPRELYKSLTWDRGKEMADHQRFSLATDIRVYFCDPQQPWQRGSNENTNGLLRQYFPKEMDLPDIRCLVPECGGISHVDPAFREGLWARYFMAAPRPRTRSELQYSDRRRLEVRCILRNVGRLLKQS